MRIVICEQSGAIEKEVETAASNFDPQGPFGLIIYCANPISEQMGGLCCHCIYPSADSIETKTNLNGRVVMITGVTRGGIGYETARILATRGGHIILTGRRMAELERVKQAIIDSIISSCCCCRKKDINEPRIDCIQLDLTDLFSVRSCVQTFLALNLPLHMLINNAGILSPGYRLIPPLQIESQLFVNHLAHFYLTLLLLPSLRRGHEESGLKSRVINVASVAHQQAGMTPFNLDNAFSPKRERYEDWMNYGNSKLANILSARLLALRYSSFLSAFSLHPGVIATSLGQGECYIRCFCHCCACCLKSVNQGSATTIYVALTPELTEDVKYEGEYFDNCALAPTSSAGKSMTLAKALWYESVKRLKEWEQTTGVDSLTQLEVQDKTEGRGVVTMPEPPPTQQEMK